jgi:hypothetical protein
MDDPARRFRGLFARKPADNPLLVAGRPGPDLRRGDRVR